MRISDWSSDVCSSDLDHVIFTSGASEAIAIALTRAKARRIVTSTVEHDAVMRVTKDAERLGVDEGGGVRLPFDVADSLVAIQHVNKETGVNQPLDRLSASMEERSVGNEVYHTL